MIRAPLFVPANRPDRFAKAAASGADAVILDLEDAVAAEDKDAARSALTTGFTDLPIIVRVNAHGTPWHEADLAAVAELPLAAVMLPKAEEATMIAAVAQATGKPIIALIESARGLANARAVAASGWVTRLAFGSIDYCADLGCAHLRDVLLPARAELVLASRLADLEPPLDGVTAQIDDATAAFDDATHARALGFAGKLSIHPRQVPDVLRAFAPTAEEVSWAKRVLGSGDGAVRVDGAMVDAPVRAKARAILEER
jgi:citrate lyase subunit beta/citryl-CoA lyase